MTNMQKHYVKTLPPKRVGEFVELAEGYRATANTERLVLCIHAINRRRFWRIASFRSDAGFGRYRRIAINLNCTSTRPGSAAHRHPQSFHWYIFPGRTAQIESIAFELISRLSDRCGDLEAAGRFRHLHRRRDVALSP